MAELLPAESMALTVARAQCARGDNPEINTTAMLVLALDRLTGREDWTQGQAGGDVPGGGAMKLFLWRNVLYNYTAGMAFAIAASADEARGMLIRQADIHAGDDFAKEPEVHELTEPFCAFVYGGG